MSTCDFLQNGLLWAALVLCNRDKMIKRTGYLRALPVQLVAFRVVVFPDESRLLYQDPTPTPVPKRLGCTYAEIDEIPLYMTARFLKIRHCNRCQSQF